MLTEFHQKITNTHLERDAFLYIRQSSLRQVFENQESTKRQYALRERAIALGWPSERIHVIDSDLGQSGAQSAGRDGFSHLVSEVAMGHVGIVLGLEVSRLARNNADWHRLLELSAMSSTLILDEDGVYDPTQFNDRLLLGLKGAMSEAELHVLKARLQGGIRNKAKRGELELPLPIGLVYQPDKTVVLDPDVQIQHSVRWLFETFRHTGSAMAVLKRFKNEGLEFPVRVRRGIGKGDMHWGSLNHSRILQILHNPRYAGAFVYGRTRTGRNAKMQPTPLKVAQENWQVLIPEAHAGYITWEEFGHNQLTLRRNAGGFGNGRRGSVPREGAGLLQGRILCGFCGARMRVRYQKVGGEMEPYYQCAEASVRHAGTLCQSVRGSHIDKAIEALLLELVATPALEAALAVQQEITNRISEADTLRQTRLERARYEAELSRRRFFAVDPSNRLVADTLEADWNEQLRQLDDLQQEQNRQRDADKNLLSEEARSAVLKLAKDFSCVWSDERTTSIERKRMVALLIEDVTLLKQVTIDIHVRFRGGQTQSLNVPCPVPIARIRKVSKTVVDALDELLDTHNDAQAAEQLNKLGHRNWKGEKFTGKRVSFVRSTYNLNSRYARLRDRGFINATEMSKHLGISQTTVYEWAGDGLLQREAWASGTKCLFATQPGMIIKKGCGGRGAKPPEVSTVPSSKQEIV
jgi:DNA invertase Pin-like site-specific DNA recombinase